MRSVSVRQRERRDLHSCRTPYTSKKRTKLCKACSFELLALASGR
jgi:hypothetical protein